MNAFDYDQGQQSASDEKDKDLDEDQLAACLEGSDLDDLDMDEQEPSQSEVPTAPPQKVEKINVFGGDEEDDGSKQTSAAVEKNIVIDP